jgi:predicted RNA polymerase sigma factor
LFSTAGLAALKTVEQPLAGYHLFYAARADMLERTGGDPPDLERAIYRADSRARFQLPSAKR